ncbi:MAG: hypothetical protein S0880_15870 [Actinomycetota bacterium]|nr:hypothetical protein [Actinomycetota bacterium]
MANERWSVLALAHPRSPWCAALGRWSTSAAIPVELVRCVSATEVRARLASGVRSSALVVDAGVVGLDRDLVDAAREVGCTTLVVEDHTVSRDLASLGAAGSLPGDFGRDDLLAILSAHAAPVAAGGELPGPVAAASSEPGGDGRLVAVCGPGGTGSSVVAMALTQRLAAGTGPGSVVLADLALHADLAMLCGAGDVMPALPELVEAFRHTTPTDAEIRDVTFAVDAANHDLLLGLRRHRDWAALRPRAVSAAVGGLRRAYGWVVADTDADVEGEAECGSVEVEERNVLARSAVLAADAVVVVGGADTKGVHALVRCVAELAGAGVAADRIVPVCNRAPRSPRQRAEVTAAVGSLTRAVGGGLCAPVFLPDKRSVEAALRDGARLPTAIGDPVHRAVEAVIARAASTPTGTDEPVPIAAGSLGAWADVG